MMKRVFLVGLATVTIGSQAAYAEPERPVLEAAIKASPSQRLEAVTHVRSAYPNLAEDVHAQLKAAYPELERGVMDAALQTWREHPGEVLDLVKETKTKFGPRASALRKAVRVELETSYPDFENRLSGVLKTHGIASKWLDFVRTNNPELADHNRKKIAASIPEFKNWYPGKFLKMRLSARPDTNPLFDKLQGIVERNPQLLPRLATELVENARSQSPGLIDGWNKQRFENRRALREALESEFPGARQKIVAVVESTDPELPGEVMSFVRGKNASLRADFRKHLDEELPGFETEVQRVVSTRYPELKSQLLAILQR